ncbi:MAG: hypothetical protein COZ85_01375 [Candidatus Moranbacteria bacterium CG_4_8_14_3_um_filter_34_16]|nr:MAG: hypothetical protein COT31_03830 [Candidatus Moranbacteria bacterium CG08_land_8_20_14_0_20_34_16]PIW95170.1 MAG: hypothetical protein COZ85_01375 [Candidatus Moranbacteria bacterium CG_4_8_14_3_um_filter_34_16]PJA89506.1 MAG: hypothetical protein CO138_00085 [Candidatus Moranbacteria bacterium CG_4_9_14_3_um_filter_33_15]
MKIYYLMTGIIAALGALILEVFFPLFSSNFFSLISQDPAINLSFMIAISIEELTKGIFIWKLFSSQTSQEKKFLGAFFFATGFSLLEITLNIFKNNSWDFFYSSFLPLLGLFLIHTFTSFIFVLFLAFQKKISPLSFFYAFLLAFSFHFLYNWTVLFLNF